MIEELAISDFLKAIIAAGGGGAIVALGIVKFLGESWINNRLSKELERLKHSQDVEIKRLQLDIDARLSGHLKIQDIEFEILPKAWKRLNSAFGVIEWVIAPLQSYPDLSRLTSERLDLVLSSYKFIELDKREILESSDKQKTFQTIEFRYRSVKARKQLSAFGRYVENNSILFPKDIKVLFEKFTKTLASSISSKEIGQEYNDYKMQGDAWKTLQEEAKPLYTELESLIYERLRSHGNQ